MRRLALLTLTFLLFAALVAACAGAAAPAAEEAPAALEAAAPAEEAANGTNEMPQPDPADQAEDATAEPAEETDSTAPAADVSAELRTFRLVPGQTSMQYAVEEEFFGQAIPFVTAIGTTNAISGELALRVGAAGVTIEQSSFTADISTLTSDQGRRDRAIRDRWLESSRFPFATFVASDVSDMPADAALGKDVRFRVSGDMTIRDVTNPMTWDMTARLDGGTLTGVGTTYFLMRDYGFEPPDIAGILRVTDGVTVTVNFVAEEVQ